MRLFFWTRETSLHNVCTSRCVLRDPRCGVYAVDSAILLPVSVMELIGLCFFFSCMLFMMSGALPPAVLLLRRSKPRARLAFAASIPFYEIAVGVRGPDPTRRIHEGHGGWSF